MWLLLKLFLLHEKAMTNVCELLFLFVRARLQAENGSRACASLLFLHLSKFSHENVCFAPELKFIM